MKQRIRVVGIIKGEEGVLVLKRNRGRSDAPVLWELPTGKIKFGEQPEEAIVRTISDDIGLSVNSIAIKDAITFLALEGASRLSNLYIVYEVGVIGSKPSPKDRYTAYKYVKDLQAPGVHLSEHTISTLEIIEGKIASARANPRDTANAIAVHTDGASRGNPGPSGIGYCIHDQNGHLIEKGGEFIGFATSRVAEYYALKKGLERAIALGIKTARFFSDSLMVVNQMNGIILVKNSDIAPIHDDVVKLLDNFDNISFTHVNREQNTIADAEANHAIDGILVRG